MLCNRLAIMPCSFHLLTPEKQLSLKCYWRFQASMRKIQMAYIASSVPLSRSHTHTDWNRSRGKLLCLATSPIPEIDSGTGSILLCTLCFNSRDQSCLHIQFLIISYLCRFPIRIIPSYRSFIIHRNSMAAKQPLSSMCFSSSCWNLTNQHK